MLILNWLLPIQPEQANQPAKQKTGAIETEASNGEKKKNTPSELELMLFQL